MTTWKILDNGYLEGPNCYAPLSEAVEYFHAEALAMDRFISAGKLTIPADAPHYEFCVAARESWMSRRKPIRDAACGYGDAFVEFHHSQDFDTFTGACIAWINMMDSAHFENRMHDERVARQVYVVTYSHPNGDVTTHGKFPHAARQSAYNLAAAMDKQYCAPGHEIYVDIQ